MNIDRKYQIRALNPCSGNTHDEYDSILFYAARVVATFHT